MLVAASGIDVPEGTPIVAADDMTIAVWLFPHDPFLPGLAAALDTTAVDRSKNNARELY